MPAGVWLVMSAPGGTPRLAASAFALSVSVMFAASATVHIRRWSTRTTEVLFRLDHTGILLAFAGTATAVALLGLDGWRQTLLLGGVWGGSALGALMVWWPRATPRGFLTALCFLIGGLALPVLPELYRQAGPAAIGLLVAGGVVFAVGSAIVGARRPDPSPEFFGYHEIWHLFVIAGIVLYYVMVAATLLPVAG